MPTPNVMPARRAPAPVPPARIAAITLEGPAGRFTSAWVSDDGRSGVSRRHRSRAESLQEIAQAATAHRPGILFVTASAVVSSHLPIPVHGLYGAGLDAEAVLAQAAADTAVPVADQLAAARARQHDRVPELTADADPVVVATDGSARRVDGAGAWAWVTHDGFYGVGYEPALSRVPAALEFLAVIRAVDATPGNRSLVVHTDCAAVVRSVEALRGGAPVDSLEALQGSRAFAALYLPVLELAKHLERRDITVTWVKGHAGHALNEAANALAIHARRMGATTSHDQLNELAGRVAANYVLDAVTPTAQ